MLNIFVGKALAARALRQSHISPGHTTPLHHITDSARRIGGCVCFWGDRLAGLVRGLFLGVLVVAVAVAVEDVVELGDRVAAFDAYWHRLDGVSHD